MENVFLKLRDGWLERMPRDGEGRPLCECGQPVDPTTLACKPCEARRKREERQQQANALTAPWRKRLPAWPYARLDCAAWVAAVDPRAVEAARLWSPERGGIVICGPTGAGKTSAVVARLHLTMEMAYAAAMRGDRVRLPRLSWSTEAGLIAARRGYPLGQGESPVVDAATTAPIAVIDEVGFAGGERLVMEVVDARYAAGLGTSLTTGHRPAALAAKYGQACWRRLVERAEVVDLFEGQA